MARWRVLRATRQARTASLMVSLAMGRSSLRLRPEVGIEHLLRRPRAGLRERLQWEAGLPGGGASGARITRRQQVRRGQAVAWGLLVLDLLLANPDRPGAQFVI